MTQNIFQDVVNLPKTFFVPPSEIQYSADKVLLVDMYQAAVTSPDMERPVLATKAIMTCEGLAVFNPRNCALGLSHLVMDEDDPSNLGESSVSLLKRMLQTVRGQEGCDHILQVRIIGPHASGSIIDTLIKNIIRILDQNNAKIISADFGSKGAPRHFGVDSANWHKGLLRGSIDAVDISQTSPDEMSRQAKEIHRVIEGLRGNSPEIEFGSDDFLDLRSNQKGFEPWPNLTP